MLYTVTTATLQTTSFTTAQHLFAALNVPNNKWCVGGGAEVDKLGVQLFNTKDYISYKKTLRKGTTPRVKDLLKHKKESQAVNA